MRYIVPLLLLMLISCGGNETKTEPTDELDQDSVEMGLDEALKSADKKEKPAMDSVDLKKSIKKIEAKYGEQWDFCDCVVKGDSINKAFMKPNIPDKEFDRLSKRFDEIDEKCQAFRIQDADRTPEERALHEKKVRRCLREAGIKQ
ncbi:MAG: hypothetical protein EP305_04980 [Bacteroidetes bacterium]|nr:MAG: hypothetical protein EP305_04980 [Bacteroidota bacterium]